MFDYFKYLPPDTQVAIVNFIKHLITLFFISALLYIYRDFFKHLINRLKSLQAGEKGFSFSFLEQVENIIKDPSPSPEDQKIEKTDKKFTPINFLRYNLPEKPEFEDKEGFGVSEKQLEYLIIKEYNKHQGFAEQIINESEDGQKFPIKWSTILYHLTVIQTVIFKRIFWVILENNKLIHSRLKRLNKLHEENDAKNTDPKESGKKEEICD